MTESEVEVDNKVSLEAAEAEFERFATEMDLDLDTADMDAEDLTAFSKMKKRLIRAIMRGSLVITEDGEAQFTPQRPKSRYQETITFHERTGASVMAMDMKKKGHDVAKTYAAMADMCKVTPKVFAGLVGEDIKICEALFAFLME